YHSGECPEECPQHVWAARPHVCGGYSTDANEVTELGRQGPRQSACGDRVTDAQSHSRVVHEAERRDVDRPDCASEFLQQICASSDQHHGAPPEEQRQREYRAYSHHLDEEVA